MAQAGPQHLALIGARANAPRTAPVDGSANVGPGRMFLKGASAPRFHEEYVARDFDTATLGVTAFAPVTCVLELYGRGGDSVIPILLETFEMNGESAKAFVYSGPCFEIMGLKLVSITGKLEGVSWLEHQ